MKNTENKQQKNESLLKVFKDFCKRPVRDFCKRVSLRRKKRILKALNRLEEEQKKEWLEEQEAYEDLDVLCGFEFDLARVEAEALAEEILNPRDTLRCAGLTEEGEACSEGEGAEENSDAQDDLPFSAKGLPIKLIKEKKEKDEPFSLMEFKRKYRTDDVYEHVKLPLSVSELSAGGEIMFEHLDTECVLIVNRNTVVISEGDEVSELIIKRPEVYYRREEDPLRFPCTCLCALDPKTYELFGVYGDVEEKAEQISVFSKLSKHQREFVFSMASRPVQEEEQSDSQEAYTPIRDLASLEMMYEVCKPTYTPSVRSRIENLKMQLRNAHGSDRTDIINQMAFAIGIDTRARKHPKRSYEECMAIMDKHVYGLRELKENVVEFIISMQESGASYFRMLLVGPPGVGKTAFADGITECLGDTPLLHIDCSGVNFISAAGLIKSYGGAKAGKIMDGFLERGQCDLVMLLDELDKMCIDKDGDPYGALIKPLGPQKKFYDEYVADDTDVSSTKFIATANDVSKIPGYILSRFENNVFYLEAYTKEEKLEIAQKHIIPKKLAEYKLTDEDCSFSDEALSVIIDEYCEDEGVRELEGNITLLLRKMITERFRGMISFPFRADAEYVESHLKKKNGKNNKRIMGFA